mmetsp:Transcript_25820/g.31836  ORF Transcript_25820/g.31836 Transcript_25820/m.31836 type:complete len:340 (+) Transcript_25820:108-1127(+)
MPPKKRSSAVSIAPSSKRSKSSISIGSARQAGTRVNSSSSVTGTGTAARAKESDGDVDPLRKEFIELLSKPQYKNGITNTQLKATFPGDLYLRLVPTINSLTREERLNMSKGPSGELMYKLLNEEIASKFAGLDLQTRMVYQVIETSGNKGIWTRDIRTKSNIQQQALNKIFKTLEARKLIKPVKAVNAKSQKRYMLYDLTPSKEVTGGPWYTAELEFDHEFISEMRKFIMHLCRRLNGGKGVTLKQIAEKMKMANVSRVELKLQEVQQLMQTLAFDYMIEQGGFTQDGEVLFIAAKRVTAVCDFKWWGVLCPDFHFRNIRFEDDVVLSAHEPHHHTAS